MRKFPAYENSFASTLNIHLKEWAYDLNRLTPKDVYRGTRDKYYFYCAGCGHTMLMRINNIVYNNQFCIICAGQSICGYRDCEPCYKKSFEYTKNKHVKEWSYKDNGDKTPLNVMRSSGRKYYFKCNGCGHLIKKRIADITAENRFCVICAGQAICGIRECESCYKKSFEYTQNEHLKEWNYELNKNNTPLNVMAGSGRKFKFTCKNCNKIILQSPTKIVSRNQFCKGCGGRKTEKKLLNFLRIHFENITPQFAPPFLKNLSYDGNQCRFDFLIEDKIIIELDGPQHFQQVSNWQSPKVTFNMDILKMRAAFENNYKLIRIYQPDVMNDIGNWKGKILRAVKNIKNKNSLLCYFIEKNDKPKDVYEDFYSFMDKYYEGTYIFPVIESKKEHYERVLNQMRKMVQELCGNL